MDFDEFKLGEEIVRHIEESLRKRGRVNVLVAGRSGVGKSTLVNVVFQGHIAETGQGRPVTQEIKEYTKDGVPVTICDTKGLEMDCYKDTLQQLESFVNERAKDSDPQRHIHVAWLCISEDSRRVEEGESKAAELLAQYMPVIGVITKARHDQGFRAIAQNCLPAVRNIVSVRALHEVDDEGHELHPRGLTELVELTMEVVPDGQRNAFAAAQRVSIELKRVRAHAIVATAAVAAAGVGVVPIPFSDAALLVPIEIGMLGGISAVFGLPLSQGSLATLVSSAATAVGATLSGRAIVTNLLKLVPGANIVAGIIAAGTAMTLTTTFGEAYIAVLTRLVKSNDGQPPSEEEVAREFAQELRQRVIRKRQLLASAG